tara:strand:- start:3646 stop:3906 length:261 start_codon:yes stop_codon:yes gene_type:complete
MNLIDNFQVIFLLLINYQILFAFIYKPLINKLNENNRILLINNDKLNNIKFILDTINVNINIINNKTKLLVDNTKIPKIMIKEKEL